MAWLFSTATRVPSIPVDGSGFSPERPVDADGGASRRGHGHRGRRSGPP